MSQEQRKEDDGAPSSRRPRPTAANREQTQASDGGGPDFVARDGRNPPPAAVTDTALDYPGVLSVGRAAAVASPRATLTRRTVVLDALPENAAWAVARGSVRGA